MRYTHGLHLIRKRKHRGYLSLAITVIVLLLILFLGFTEVDARLFFGGFFQSFTRVTIAYAISLVIALGLTVLISLRSDIETLLVPILDVLQSFPSFALFPLLILWLGRTSFVTIVVLVVAMIWPILFTLISAQKQLREDVLEAAKIFGATGWKYYTYILFPLLLPSLVTGSIVAWGEAWETIIAAEIIVNITGVGNYLGTLGTTNHSSTLVIGIFLLLLILFIINKYVWLPLLNITTRYQQE